MNKKSPKRAKNVSKQPGKKQKPWKNCLNSIQVITVQSLVRWCLLRKKTSNPVETLKFAGIMKFPVAKDCHHIRSKSFSQSLYEQVKCEFLCLNHIGKGNAAYPEYVGDSSLVKQNPTQLRKNAKKETDPVSKENLPLSNPEATECYVDPSQTPKSKGKDHVRQIRFSDNEDESDFNDSFTKTKKPKVSKVTNVAKVIEIIMIGKCERTAERGENKRRHAESESSRSVMKILSYLETTFFKFLRNKWPKIKNRLDLQLICFSGI
ncbi:hypothetical protein DAPPUDRAFT_108150 [Daphnia pulex]|uniref:Uncharacterized protein n=1 Tax=Daphnia pulex TaxID=6669 RepID=E9GZB0_DAPPU|nr:hypothetical protein DAPPUDRAFT_108150 [Daphnia pulex]|eukprot:EFX75190.1 hypothetical protein DAPPUDRAFT_108150 [Daphnia pulex]